VAVGAEHRQVLDTVVAAVAVHVVEGHRERLTSPFVDAAFFAAIVFQACGD
jgi:hypothetical protein